MMGAGPKGQYNLCQSEGSPQELEQAGSKFLGLLRRNKPCWYPGRPRNTLPSRTLRDDFLLFEAVLIDCGGLLQL